MAQRQLRYWAPSGRTVPTHAYDPWHRSRSTWMWQSPEEIILRGQVPPGYPERYDQGWPGMQPRSNADDTMVPIPMSFNGGGATDTMVGGPRKDTMASRGPPTMYGLHGMESRYGNKSPAEIEAAMAAYAQSKGYRFEAIPISGDDRKAQTAALLAKIKPGDAVYGFSAGGYAARDAVKQLPLGTIKEAMIVGAPGVEKQFYGIDATFIPTMPGVEHMDLPSMASQTPPRHGLTRADWNADPRRAGYVHGVLGYQAEGRPSSLTGRGRAVTKPSMSPREYGEFVDRLESGQITWEQLPSSWQSELTRQLGSQAPQKYAEAMGQPVVETARNQTAGNPEYVAAVNREAARLGVSPRDLSTVIGYETIGRYSPDVRGGAGNKYYGLIQFGPAEQRKYGITPGMTVDEQMDRVGDYLIDRGLKPGSGVLDIYSTINAGSPGHYGSVDASGKSVRQHVAEMMAGPYREQAEAWFGPVAEDAFANATPYTEMPSASGMQESALPAEFTFGMERPPAVPAAPVTQDTVAGLAPDTAAAQNMATITPDDIIDTVPAGPYNTEDIVKATLSNEPARVTGEWNKLMNKVFEVGETANKQLDDYRKSLPADVKVRMATETAFNPALAEAIPATIGDTKLSPANLGKAALAKTFGYGDVLGTKLRDPIVSDMSALLNDTFTPYGSGGFTDKIPSPAVPYAAAVPAGGSSPVITVADQAPLQPVNVTPTYRSAQEVGMPTMASEPPPKLDPLQAVTEDRATRATLPTDVYKEGSKITLPAPVMPQEFGLNDPLETVDIPSVAPPSVTAEPVVGAPPPAAAAAPPQASAPSMASQAPPSSGIGGRLYRAIAQPIAPGSASFWSGPMNAPSLFLPGGGINPSGGARFSYQPNMTDSSGHQVTTTDVHGNQVNVGVYTDSQGNQHQYTWSANGAP